MGVQDGFPVSAGYTNPRYISKNVADDMPFPLAFSYGAAGPNISSIQAAVNKLYTATGASESSTGTVYDAPPSTISNGDSYEDALSVLAGKFSPASGHTHSGAAGQGGPIAASSLVAFPLLGYIEAGTTITGVSGSSTNVTSLLTGKTPSTDMLTAGVCVDSGNNKIRIFSATTATAFQNLVDSLGNLIYGRLTYAASVWTLRYYSEIAGVETAYSGFSSQNLYWYYQELFYPNQSPSIYNPVMDLFVSDPIVNASVGSFGSASLVATFTANQKGKITTAANVSIQIAESQVTNLVSDLAGKQPVGNYLTNISGDLVANGPGSVTGTLATVNSNVGSFGSATQVAAVTANAKGLVTAASNVSIQIAESQVTNLTTDLAAKVSSVGTFGSTPNAQGASISGGVITLQPADATNPGGVSNTTQTFQGAKTFLTINTNQPQNSSSTNSFSNSNSGSSAAQVVNINSDAVTTQLISTSTAGGSTSVVQGNGSGGITVGSNNASGSLNFISGNALAATFNSSQILSLVNSLAITSGGTGQTSITSGGTGGVGSPSLVSGTYTPTLANISGTSALSANGAGIWMRVGNVVWLFVYVQYTSTTGGSSFAITLPVTSASTPVGFGSSVSALGETTSGAVFGFSSTQAQVFIPRQATSNNAVINFMYLIN